MSDDIKIKKQVLRAEAKKARSLLSLDADEQKRLCNNFFDNLHIDKEIVIAAYWPKGRELDTSIIIEECLSRGAKVALPVVKKGLRKLKFALWDENLEMEKGAFGIMQPTQDSNTTYVDPSVFLIPLLAFDRSGYRLGYGGGYYDTTLKYYKDKMDIIAVGIAYAKQACLFNLPRDEHDMRLDWIITEQSAQKF